EIISSVLEVVYPDDPGYLWTELQTSKTVSKILGDETVWPPSDRSYLATLAEAYNVKAWDTRKQVSSIMVGIASYKALLAFIPGERTMTRILSECSASLRKSLQGLDYFAAEGARAFNDLSCSRTSFGEWSKKRESTRSTGGAEGGKAISQG
ncbi:unnamed protein product, partial [Pocillopora meandrina]